jgi:hypothetical protein
VWHCLFSKHWGFVWICLLAEHRQLFNDVYCIRFPCLHICTAGGYLKHLVRPSFTMCLQHVAQSVLLILAAIVGASQGMGMLHDKSSSMTEASVTSPCVYLITKCVIIVASRVLNHEVHVACCRLWTAGAMVGIVGCHAGPWLAVAAGTFVATCMPHALLWWPRRRPAAAKSRRVKKKPAAAGRAGLKRKPASAGNWLGMGRGANLEELNAKRKEDKLSKPGSYRACRGCKLASYVINADPRPRHGNASTASDRPVFVHGADSRNFLVMPSTATQS